MPNPDLPTRAFRLIVRLYPARYRARYGEEMEGFFLRERAAGAGGVGYWIRLGLDHAQAIGAVRSRDRRERREERMTTLGEDLRAALRSLRRAPRFTLFSVFTLALGVGSVTAVFTVVERVVLRPMPYPDSERMALVGTEQRLDPGSLGPLSPALLAALSARPGVAEQVVAGRTTEAILWLDADPERVDVAEVSPGLFDFFGAAPTVGRLFRQDDHEPGAPPIVVIGERVWRDRFGLAPDVVGRTVRLDDRVHTIVGVLDRSFVTPPEIVESDEFWLPLVVDAGIRDSFSLAGVLRLRPGASAGEMDAHVDAMIQDMYDDPGRSGYLSGGSLRTYREAIVGPIASDLRGVLGAVALLLLIACVNVAGLLLTRGAERRHEFGVLAALGASRGRIVRKLLLESATLAAVGGLIGVALAWGALELFRAFAPVGLPRLTEVSLDGRGVLFAIVVSTITSMVFGLLPALRSTHGLPGGGGSTRGATLGRSESRLRGALVASETALAVVLTVGSALLAHDLVRVTSEDPGFRPDGLLVTTLNLDSRFEREAWVRTWEDLIDRARAVPGVDGAAVATQAPWDGTRMASTYRPEGVDAGDEVFAATVAVAGDYLDVLGTRLVAGRAFDARDAADASPVLLVNETFVERFWSGEAGVGKRIVVDGGEEVEFQVVGVLEDVRTRPGRDVSPHVFHTLANAPWREMELMVRTRGDAASLAPALRSVVRELDPGLPVTSLRTMEALSSSNLATPRFYAALFGGFSLIALILALVGVYGTTAYATRSRLREAGIRMVLGARKDQIVGALVARAGASVALGAVTGLIVAALGSSIVADTLRHIGPRDAATYAMVGVVVLITGLTAAWIPAAAAGRADPAVTLREE